MHLGGRKDELHMSRGLLHRLEQRVPRRLREHVHLVDDVDLIPPRHRLVHDILGQFAHISGGIPAGGVDLNHVETALGRDRTAGITFAAGLSVLRIGAVHRLRKNPRQRGLADPARTDEKVGVRGPLLTDRIHEGPDHMLLPDHIGEPLRPPFAGDDLIFRHHASSGRSKAASTASC